MPDEPPVEIFRFQFFGRLASKGELNFYELSRSQYAAARLLYTIARYQETGRVPQRITEKSTADIRARPPERGSYIYDAVLFLQQNAAQAAIGVPLNGLFTLVWEHLFPSASAWMRAQALARSERRQLDQKALVSLSKEETRRLEILKQIEQGKEVTKRQALGIFKDIHKNIPENDNHSIRRTNVKLIIDDLNLEINKEETLLPYQKELEGLSKEQNQKLFGKARSLVTEIGLPLRGSADLLSIGTDKNRYVELDSERLSELLELEEPDHPEYLKGKVIQYNVESAYGRLRLSGEQLNVFGVQISFNVEISNRKKLSTKIIDAMKEDEVTGEFYVFRDAEGNIKRVVLADFV
jgi:hypothetical protein